MENEGISREKHNPIPVPSNLADPSKPSASPALPMANRILEDFDFEHAMPVIALPLLLVALLASPSAFLQLAAASFLLLLLCLLAD